MFNVWSQHGIKTTKTTDFMAQLGCHIGNILNMQAHISTHLQVWMHVLGERRRYYRTKECKAINPQQQINILLTNINEFCITRIPKRCFPQCDISLEHHTTDDIAKKNYKICSQKRDSDRFNHGVTLNFLYEMYFLDLHNVRNQLLWTI